MREWRRPAGATATVLLCLALARATRADAPGATAAGAPAPPAGLLSVQVGDCILEAPAVERGRLESLAERAREILPRVEAELGGARAAAPYRIALIPPGPDTDESLKALDAQAPSWASGFIIPAARRGGIRTALADRYPHDDLDSVLAHEAAHMLLYDAAGPGLPRWFGEGVATAVERSWGLRDILVYGSSVLTGRLPPLRELDAAFDASDDRARAAYAASFDFVLWTVRTYGDGAVRYIVQEARTRPFPEAWRVATGVTLERSEADWRRGSLLLYRWVPALTGTTALWTGITLLALVAGARRRARARRLLEEWRAEDGPDPPEEVVH
jgi:peptidase MA superfamily protein